MRRGRGGRARHSQWDVEHIPPALLQQQGGLATQILKKLGVDAGLVMQRVEAALARSPRLGYEVSQIYATPRILRLFEAADAERERLKDEFIGSEHLFIAIAAEREGEA